MTSQVENWSYSSREVSIQIPVGIAYGSDIDLAERLMLEAARGANRVLADRPPGVLLSAFGPNSIDMVIVCWIGDPEEGVGNVPVPKCQAGVAPVPRERHRNPYPQQDVSLKIGRYAGWPMRWRRGTRRAIRLNRQGRMIRPKVRP
jgi:small-conductance mechanosensitive channel